MNAEEHSQRHFELHKNFEELLQDFTDSTGKIPDETTLTQFLVWSLNQTKRDKEGAAHTSREKLTEFLYDNFPDETVIFFEGYDDAIVGLSLRFGRGPLVIYDREKCIECLMKDGMSHEEAEEYFEFNSFGAWVGDETPEFLITPV
jgi:hypothetical protein